MVKTPKAQSIKEITDKLDLIKIEYVCFVKDSVKRIRRLAEDWGKKSFPEETSDQELSSKAYKEVKTHL